VLQIKGNQPKLLARLQARHAAAPEPAGAFYTYCERRSGRLNYWKTSVYDCPDPDLRAAWAGLARCVVVVKTVTYRGHTHERWHFYRTSLATLPVAALAAGIRGHWGIENKLHRARDVQFNQDTNGIRHHVAAANLALLNTLALNYLLANISQSVSYAQISFAQNIQEFLLNLRT